MSYPDLIRLDGKIALVTGSAQGIGFGCAVALAEAGADIVLNDKPGGTCLSEAAARIEDLGRKCWPIEANVFAPEGGQSLVDRAVAEAGQIDILVSNPAYSLRCGFLDFPHDEFAKVVDGTFQSGFRISQAVARHMVERGQGGKIVFISSVQGEMPFARSAPYGASKAAVNLFTQTVAVELFPHRINVNAIEPGWIDTPNERATFTGETLQKEGEKLPWGRLGQPEDIGRAAAFLCSGAADYITGTILPVDGGFRLKHLRLDDLPDEKDPL